MLLKTISALTTIVLLATSATAVPWSPFRWEPAAPKSPIRWEPAADFKVPTKVPTTKLPTKNILPVKKGKGNGASLDGCSAPPIAGNITNHGGKILSGKVNVYHIYYGNWTDTKKGILENFSKNIGGSNYSNIEISYGASGEIAFAGSINDSYSLGTDLGGDGVEVVVQNTLKNKLLPLDTNAIYIVMTSPDVAEGNSSIGTFCGDYCGYHYFTEIQNQNYTFAFVGNPENCLDGCGPCNQKVSPNKDPGVDAMISILAHETMEVISDPEGNTWFDDNQNECSDKCSYNYGDKVKKQGGAYYNIVLGGMKYLIQQNWDASTQQCQMSA